jgi:hypothetical protein
MGWHPLSVKMRARPRTAPKIIACFLVFIAILRFIVHPRSNSVHHPFSDADPTLSDAEKLETNVKGVNSLLDAPSPPFVAKMRGTSIAKEATVT